MKKQNVTSKVWRVALVVVGTVIGAGFASGAEIMAYFTGYGEAGLWAIGIAGVLFFAGIYGTLKIAYEYRCTEYGTFTEKIAGKWVGAALDALVVLSMLLGYGVMLAGSGAIFLQQWAMPEDWGALLMAGAVMATLRFGSNGLLAVNRIITPILIIGILLASIYGIITKSFVAETIGLSLQPLSIFTAQPVKNVLPAMWSAITYASYNMLGGIAVLVGMSKHIQTEKEGAMVGGCAACILVALTLALGLATFLNYDTIRNIPIPVLRLLDEQEFWSQLYVIVLLGAMYTTAVADAFGLLSRVAPIRRCSEGAKLILLTALAMVLARMGFARLVEKGYRLLGYFGVVQILLIVIKCIPKKENINGKQKR